MTTLRIGNTRIPVTAKREERYIPYIVRRSISEGVLQRQDPEQTYFSTEYATDIDSDVLKEAFYIDSSTSNTTLTTVNLSGLTQLSGQSALQKTFYKCTNVTSIDVSNLTTITAEAAMQDCFGYTGISSIDMHSLTTLPASSALYNCFDHCTNLTSVNLSGLTQITGQNAMGYCFSDCTSLASVDLSNLTSITSHRALFYCFYRCTGLTSVTIGNENQVIDFGLASVVTQFDSMFSGCTQDITLYIATTRPVLSAMTGYPKFGASGNVNIVYLTDATLNLNITGTWNSIYFAAMNQTVTSPASMTYIQKNTPTDYVITTPTGLYVGHLDGIATTGTLTVDLTAVTYNTITLQPDIISPFVNGYIAVYGKQTPLSSTTLSAQIYNATGTTQSVSYLYKQDGYAQVTGTIAYLTGDVVEQIVMPTGPSIVIEPEPSYPDYPWRIAETVVAPAGYNLYESTCWHVNNGKSVSKILVSGTTEYTFYLNSFAEGNYDYSIISTLDASTIPLNHTAPTVKAHTRGNQSDPSVFPGNYTKVDYIAPDTSEHWIYVVYIKDGSVDKDNDRGYLAFEA